MPKQSRAEFGYDLPVTNVPTSVATAVSLVGEVGVGDTAGHAIFLPFSVVAMNFLPSNCDAFRTRTRQGERPIRAITPVDSSQSAFTDELRAW
jgi:hypothetical protein